jgi:hypothetical protein
MLLLGVSSGFTKTLPGALWPEIYSLANLGGMRAITVSGAVLASALAARTVVVAGDVMRHCLAGVGAGRGTWRPWLPLAFCRPSSPLRRQKPPVRSRPHCGHTSTAARALPARRFPPCGKRRLGKIPGSLIGHKRL